jgi:hypothetical protein
MDDGVLGVYWWRDEKGIHYRARGIGPKYERLYRWLGKSSYRCTSVDWPWDFFMFDDPADHDRLIKDFGKDVMEDKDDDNE